MQRQARRRSRGVGVHRHPRHLRVRGVQGEQFEQLCINYANERPQQQFNWNVFKAEQAEYEAEGIEWQYITFVDNQECLDLLDKKGLGGVLHLLDEECAMQQGTDAKFVQKIREKHKEHKYLL